MIKKLRDIFVNLKNQLGQVIIDAFKDTEPEAIDANISQMYDGGIKSDGTIIGEYSNYTKSVKQMKGQKTEFMTLRDTGDFHDGMYFKTITAEYAEISSRDNKTTDLVSEFGIEIFGLTDDNKKDYKEYFGASIIERIKTFFK